MTINAIEMVQNGHTKPAVAAGQSTGKASGHKPAHRQPIPSMCNGWLKKWP